MKIKYLRSLIRFLLREEKKKKVKIITEPEVHDGEEEKNEFSAGGVGGAPMARRRPNKKK